MTAENSNLPATINEDTDLMAVPDYLQDKSGVAGMENLSKEDIIIPRLGLCQSNSVEKIEQSPKFIPELTDGDFFNTITKEIYGKDLLVATFYYFKNRIKFVSKTDKTIECISMNAIDGGKLSKTCASCPHSKFITDSQGKINQPCTGFFNYLISPIVKDMQTGAQHLRNDVLAFGLKRTSVKISKQWNSLITYRNKPMYSGLYKIGTVVEQGEAGYYLLPTVNNAGWVTSDIFNRLEGLYNTYKGAGVKAMDVESAVEEAVNTQEQNPNPTSYPADDIPF